MTVIVYALAISAVTWPIAFYLGMRIRQNPVTTRPNPAKGEVICGACNSPILGPPLRVVITDNDAFRYYKCPQCGSAMTAPV